MEANRKIPYSPDNESNPARPIDRNLIIGQLVGVLVTLEGAREALLRSDLAFDDRKRARERAAGAMVRLAVLRADIRGDHQLEIQLKGLDTIPLPSTDMLENKAELAHDEKRAKGAGGADIRKTA